MPGKFSRSSDGKYSGSLYLQPDRGYNVETTIDYVARHHTFDFEFTEYTGSSDLAFSQATKLFNITYRDSTFYHEAAGKNTTGLDPTIVRTGGLSGSGTNDGPLAAANTNQNPASLSFDTEGFSASPDGTYWVSDEYVPGIYKVGSDGTILAYITPPEAVLPRINSKYNFTSKSTPDSGRSPNAGFEGMAVSWDGQQLFAVLQAGLVQDGGDGAPYLRIFEWDISSLSNVTTYQAGANPGDSATLTAEYVFKVPTSSKGKARNVSDLMYLGHKTVGILVRDGTVSAQTIPVSTTSILTFSTSPPLRIWPEPGTTSLPEPSLLVVSSLVASTQPPTARSLTTPLILASLVCTARVTPLILLCWLQRSRA